MRVLIVEDDPSHLELIEVILRFAGFDCLGAVNGRIALEFLKKERFDLILMDAVMPVCDGISATRRIRERGESIPILGLTAQVNARQAFLDAGADGVLLKPFTARQLIEEVSGISPG